MFLFLQSCVCKFTSWEQQELWTEVSADVAEWERPEKGLDQRVHFFSFLRSFLRFFFSLCPNILPPPLFLLICFPSFVPFLPSHWQIDTGMQLQRWKYRHVNRQVYSEGTFSTDVCTRTQKWASGGSTSPPSSVQHVCKGCVGLMYLLCCMCKWALKTHICY